METNEAVIDTHISATVIDSNRSKDQLGIDYHHPLYLHASDAPSSMSIGIPLVGMENYSIWREAIGGMDPTALFTARGSNNKPKKYGVEYHELFLHLDSPNHIPPPTQSVSSLPELPNTSIFPFTESSSVSVDTQSSTDLQSTFTLHSSEVVSFPTSRKSTRSIKPPIWLKDFVVPTKTSTSTSLLSFGFTQSPLDYSLFIKQSAGKIVIILVYVDDLLITGDDLDMIQDTKLSLHSHFKIKDLGELRYFLGIEFARSTEGIVMHQRKYTLDLISDLGLSGAKPANSPLELHEKLTSTELDCLIDTKDDHLLTDISSYQRLIGRLLYLTHTRPDILFAIQTLSQFMHSPKLSHMTAATRVVRYLKKSPGLGIFLSSDCDSTLTAFCDADWASCPNTRRSVTGYLIKFGSSSVSWKSTKQSTISRSSAEAEYRSLASTVAEIVWLVGLLTALNVKIPLPSECPLGIFDAFTNMMWWIISNG
uniref:Reverse transcriptase Ty1/copia-type domain-containing protein n=1 Tax=Solanum lycopersicum TaxID=4081 RepID=A0A3Q7F0C2_SOLLC